MLEPGISPALTLAPRTSWRFSRLEERPTSSGLALSIGAEGRERDDQYCQERVAGHPTFLQTHCGLLGKNNLIKKP